MTRASKLLQGFAEGRDIQVYCPASSKKSVNQIEEILSNLEIYFATSEQTATFFATCVDVSTSDEQKIRNAPWRKDITVT